MVEAGLSNGRQRFFWSWRSQFVIDEHTVRTGWLTSDGLLSRPPHQIDGGRDDLPFSTAPRHRSNRGPVFGASWKSGS
jgi:hypothetical protein